ncbi:MAG: NADH-quinone oxidoreductase subunit A [Anaerolineae bacterium]
MGRRVPGARRQAGLGALGGMAVFLGVLLVGYIYVWREGALEWD